MDARGRGAPRASSAVAEEMVDVVACGCGASGRDRANADYVCVAIVDRVIAAGARVIAGESLATQRGMSRACGASGRSMRIVRKSARRTRITVYAECGRAARESVRSRAQRIEVCE
jgi:hypothetical protein